MDLNSGFTDFFNCRENLVAVCEKCYDKDTIVFLPPGDCKSFVSATVLKHMATQLTPNEKFSLYINSSGLLLDANYESCKNDTIFKVAKFETKPPDDPVAFKSMMKKSDVWMVTADQVLNALSVDAIDWSRCALVIFDDCMHCGTTSHPFRTVVEIIQQREKKYTDIRILGLTASGLAGKAPAEHITSKLCNLRDIMGCVLVTSSDILQQYMYNLRPEELIITYEPFDIELYPEAKELRRFMTFADTIKQAATNESCKSVAFATNRILEVLNILGPYCSYEVVNHFVKILRNLVTKKNFSKQQIVVIRSAITCMRTFRFSLDNFWASSYTFDEILTHVNQSVIKLIQILSGFYNENSSKFSALVFVRSRTTAIALLSFLNFISKDSRYKFIKAGCALGDSNSTSKDLPVVPLSKSGDRHLSTTINNFRAGIVNVVVATEGLEEVIDVRSCGLVVSMEPPPTFTSYLHSRGQARGHMATYAILVNTTDVASTMAALDNYKSSENFLLHYLATENISPGTELASPDAIFEPAGPAPPAFETPSGAKVNLSSAVSVINRYCARLPSDIFIKLAPKIDTKQDDICFYSTLYLPINSPVRCPITSDAATSIKRSEKQAALKAVEVLYAAGELDDNLNPVTKDDISVAELLEEFDDQLSTGKRLGTNRQRRLYLRKVPSVIQSGRPYPNVPVYVYVIEMDLVQPISAEFNPKKREILNPCMSNYLFGFCSSNKLGSVPPFPVYQRQGKVRIRILRQEEQVVFSTEEFQVLCDFHTMVFSDVLGFGNREESVIMNSHEMGFSLENSDSPLLVVPLFKRNGFFKVDVDVAREAIKGFPPAPTDEERKKFVYKPEMYKNAVVQPWYRKEKNNYYVGKVDTGIFPTNKFDDSLYENYRVYFHKKYKVDIFFDDVPLLDVDNTTNRFNLLLPRLHYRGRRDSSYPQYMVPELVVVHPMPAAYWMMAAQLPTVFYRINGLMLANEFRYMISQNVPSVAVPEDFEWEQLDYAIPSHQMIREFVTNDTELPDENDEPGTDFEIGVWNPDEVDFIEEICTSNDSLGMNDEPLVMIQQLPTPLEFQPFMLNSGNLDYDTMNNGTDRLEPCNWEDNTLPEANQSIFSEVTISSTVGFDTKALLEDIQFIIPSVDSDEESAKENNVDNLQSEKKIHIPDVEIDTTIISPTIEICFDYDYSKKCKEPVVKVREPDRPLSERVLAPELSEDMKSWFKNARTQQTTYGVPPTLILQALTASSAADGFNLERLETIGDSFLKFSATNNLFHEHAEMHEGRLSTLRSRYVSNAELFKLGHRMGIPSIMQVDKLDPMANFLPPGFVSRTCNAIMEEIDVNNELSSSEFRMQDIDEDTEVIILEKKKAPDHIQFDTGCNAFTQQRISDKSVADCLEALIGAHLISLGMDDTIKFMSFMSINVDPKKRAPPPIYYGFAPETQDSTVLEEAKKYVQFKYEKGRFHLLEEKIGYYFKDRSYLIQALTHTSYVDNRYTGCYQRLEFLGDAVLDYLVTRCLFELNSDFTPGVLTDLRSALVNNVIFASLAVKYNLNMYLQFQSHQLFQSIERFVKWQHKNGEVNFDDQIISSEDCDSDNMDIEVPKALGDIFESLAGAIFLDSDMNLEVVWRVYYALMEQRIKDCIANPPKSPCRELFEMKLYKATFSKVERKIERGIAKVTVDINDGKHSFVGSGRSYKIAKTSAAKKALNFIRRLEKDVSIKKSP